MTKVPLPLLDAVLATPRRGAIDSMTAVGWRPYVTPFDLDPNRRRLLNLDLGEPDLGFTVGTTLSAVATLEADREGIVTHLEVVGDEPADPGEIAIALLGRDQAVAPKTGGANEAREWVYGPESGSKAAVHGEPVRLWICAERAYGDRLWVVASLVRHVRV